MAIEAVQHIKRMRGGAQSHLMRASDGHYYIVKFQNNPQHRRVLANELLATRLAQKIGLPVPEAAIIEVGEWLIGHTPELYVHIAGQSEPCAAGLQFGSRYICDPVYGQIFDYLPESELERIRNREAFLGILLLDKWTCNANGRQAVYWKRSRERKYTVAFIDHGYCFNAGEWSFPDSPLRGVYPRNCVYEGAQSWQSFEPWLTALEELSPQSIWDCCGEAPPAWYGGWDDMQRLAEKLIARRARVRELVEAFRQSSRAPFPRWIE